MEGFADLSESVVAQAPSPFGPVYRVTGGSWPGSLLKLFADPTHAGLYAGLHEEVRRWLSRGSEPSQVLDCFRPLEIGTDVIRLSGGPGESPDTAPADSLAELHCGVAGLAREENTPMEHLMAELVWRLVELPQTNLAYLPAERRFFLRDLSPTLGELMEWKAVTGCPDEEAVPSADVGLVAELVTSYQVDLGMITNVIVSVDRFLDVAPRLFAAASINRLTLTAPFSRLQELLDSPFLSGIEVLNLEGAGLGDKEAMTIAAAPAIGRLRALSLAYNHIGEPGLEAIAASPYVSRLRGLELGGNRCIDPSPRPSAYDHDGLIIAVDQPEAWRFRHHRWTQRPVDFSNPDAWARMWAEVWSGYPARRQVEPSVPYADAPSDLLDPAEWLLVSESHAGRASGRRTGHWAQYDLRAAIAALDKVLEAAPLGASAVPGGEFRTLVGRRMWEQNPRRFDVRRLRAVRADLEARQSGESSLGRA